MAYLAFYLFIYLLHVVAYKHIQNINIKHNVSTTSKRSLVLGSGTGGWSNMYVEKFASGVRVRKYFEIKCILQTIPANLARIN